MRRRTPSLGCVTWGEATVETLDEMESKASGSLSDARKAAQKAQQEHAMLKQSLEQQIAGSKQEMCDSTSLKASTGQALAEAEADLAVERRDLRRTRPTSRR